MSTRSKSLVLAGVLAAVTLAPAAAFACSCGVGHRVISPADGATGVPTNAEVKIITTGPLDEFLLQRAGQPIVSLPTYHGDSTVQYIRVKPTAALEPNQTYVLSIAGTEVSRFTTGAGPDTVPPTFEGAWSMRYYNDTLTSQLSSCGGSMGYQLEIPPGSDDNSPESDLLYHVYAGTSEEDIDFTKPVMALRSGKEWLGEAMCNSNFDLESGKAVLVLSAVDRAGNESARGAPVKLPGGCGCGSGASPLAPAALLALLARRARRPA